MVTVSCLATISSGRCFFRRLVVIESLLALWAVDLHTGWIRISKAGDFAGPSVQGAAAVGGVYRGTNARPSRRLPRLTPGTTLEPRS